ncbi:MAG: PadR family transcriptional regulator [Candidatus Bathyarchaeota archaeon]|jgi:DNA-binding PadR family transcriptional regulator
MASDPCNRLRRELAKSFLDIMVIRLLKREPMWGYRLMSEIEKEHGIKVGPSVIYPLLNSLEGEGLVDVKETWVQKRKRKTYSPTERGIQQLLCLREVVEELFES